VKNLKKSVRIYESKAHELTTTQTGVRVADEDFKRQAKYIRKIEQRLHDVTQSLEEQRERYNTILTQYKELSQKPSPESHWKDNFINVFIDMMKRVGSHENFIVKDGISLKKQAKLGWRYHKKFINNHYQDEINHQL
jgi:hypothetical protein